MQRRHLLLALGVLAPALAPAGALALGNDSGDPPRPVFLDIDRITVSVLRGSEVVSHVMLALKLEIEPEGSLPLVLEKMPRLRDAFVRDWNALAARPNAAERGLDLEAGKQRMLAACERIVGPRHVRSVLVQGISQRKPVAPRT